MDIIFFSSDDWNSGLKTSKYHLATRLSRENRVFFINSVGLRMPTASKKDAGKIINKVKKFFGGAVKISENLYVYTPIVIPFHGIKVIRFLNDWFLLLQIRKLKSMFDINNFRVWTFLPNTLGVVEKLRRKEKTIYYCVDDMSSFKGVPKQLIKELDEKLTRKADVVFTVSEELYRAKKKINTNTFYSPHGVDFELFNKALTETVELPADMVGIQPPVIGFYGLISPDWIDYGLVQIMAKAKPEWSFVFIGKIDGHSKIPCNPNIHYLDVKPYEELYKYSTFFDVAILPFNINSLTIHSHPLKILEYLAAGRPVVSVKIPEARKYEDVIKIARNREDFIVKIEEALAENSKDLVSKRVEFAGQTSWEKRFNAVQTIIDNCLKP